MKRILIYFLIINSALAQNFSPSGGAGIQSSPGTIGNTTVTSPGFSGSGTTTSPATSGANNFTSPGTSVLDQGATATAPTLSPDLNVGPLDESASRLNLSPNPLPNDVNNSNAFDSSLIQAQEAPLNPPVIEQNQNQPASPDSSTYSTITTP